ncbi:hypothetical protein AMP9_0929 [plant metagenome]|uniref:Uncharacterized protein n=1 Tax=plant metagenome TaxID=1297885 RepID=A0A484PKX8_9ZZZZ
MRRHVGFLLVYKCCPLFLSKRCANLAALSRQDRQHEARPIPWNTAMRAPVRRRHQSRSRARGHAP